MSKKKHKHRFEAALPEPVITTEEVQAMLAQARESNDFYVMELCDVALDESAPHAMRASRLRLKTIGELYAKG